MKIRWSTIVIGTLLLFGCCVFTPFGMMFSAIPDSLFALAFGWVFFLYRVLPQIRVDWPAVITGFLVLAAFSVGLHFCLRRLASQIPRGDAERRWRSAWSFAIAGSIVLMFIAGTAAIGMTHHFGGLFTSGNPILDSHWRDYHDKQYDLKTIGFAVSNYADAGTTLPLTAVINDRGEALHGWQTLLLPHMDHQNVLDRIDMEVAWNDPKNRAAFQTRIDDFLSTKVPESTTSDGYALSHYAANGWLLAREKPLQLSDVTDGLRDTIFAGEINGNFPAWGQPFNVRDTSLGISNSPNGFGSPFNGGMHFLMADGSVRFISQEIDPATLRALTTPNAGDKAAFE